MADEYPLIERESGVFWVEVDKIKPNPMQPRREFEQDKLKELSESIRQYGVLQPLVVSRKEYEVDTGTAVDYELIAGERRLLASKLAGLERVPVIIRQEPAEQVKLELALIENLQREDLNPVERAMAFKELIDKFKLKHHEVGTKIGKSREFVSNTVRILALPDEIQDGLSKGLITEGHTRPLLMLSQQPGEQIVLYKEIIYRQMNVREAENYSRRIAYERARKKDEPLASEIRQFTEKLSETLGTRVSIEKKGERGKISIEFFSEEELKTLLNKVNNFYLPQETNSSVPEDKDDFLKEFTI
jgi:ParB family chromosome partitioning protein